MMMASTPGLLSPSAAKACEEHDEHAQEEQDHGREDGPHADGVVGVGAGGGGTVVDMVLDRL